MNKATGQLIKYSKKIHTKKDLPMHAFRFVYTYLIEGTKEKDQVN